MSDTLPDTASAAGDGSAASARLFAFLDELGIGTRTVEHPAVFTVAESQAIIDALPGGHTKNLFLKDKKGNLFLIVIGQDAAVDLKSLHQPLGAASRLSFGSAELLEEVLGVRPGAVTAFGPINDTAGRVTVVLDEELLRHEEINCHPLVNTATTTIARDDLIAFLRATGHEPVILAVPRRAPEADAGAEG